MRKALLLVALLLAGGPTLAQTTAPDPGGPPFTWRQAIRAEIAAMEAWSNLEWLRQNGQLRRTVSVGRYVRWGGAILIGSALVYAALDWFYRSLQRQTGTPLDRYFYPPWQVAVGTDGWAYNQGRFIYVVDLGEGPLWQTWYYPWSYTPEQIEQDAMRRLSDRYGGRISWVRRSENYRAAPTKWLGFLPAPQDIYDFLQSLSPSDRQAAVNALRDQVVLPYVDNAPIGSPASPLPGVRLDPAPNPNQWTDNPFTRPDIDTDGDGWPDSIEWHEANRRGVDWPNLINNPTAYPDPQADPDGDGYTTGEEVQVGTDPYNPSSRPQRRSPVSPDTDTDGDGWPDEEEIRRGTDPRNPNSRPPGTPSRQDTDGDGWPDEEEIRRGTDPRNPNSRPTPTSPLEDTDGDGWPDEEEVRRGTDPRNPNSRPTGTPPSQDTDGDGWPDVEEIRRGTDPLNPNSRPTGTPPLRDTDGDGWPDEEEIRRGTDPTNPNSRPTPVPPLQDTDGDGWPDEEEIRRGTDPRNPQDKPEEANEPQWPGGPPPGRLEPVQLPQTPTEAQRPLPRLSDLEQIAQAWRTQVVDRLSRALRELQDTARTRFPFSVGWTLQVNYGSTPCSFPFTIGQWTAQIAICDTPIWQAATTFRPFLAGLLFLGVAYALIRRSLDVQR